MPVKGTLSTSTRSGTGPMGSSTPLMMSASRPISRAGVRILPTMSTTADSRTQRNKMSRKNRAENSTGLNPETSGARDIS